MPIPFLSSISLNKNEVQDFKVFNLGSDPTLTSGGDFGYLWLNTSGSKTLKFWDGSNIRSLIDSTTISTSTAGTANDLSGGVAGSLPYQQGVGDTTFLGIGTADQVLTVNSGATAPQWLSQSSLSVGSATNIVGGSLGAIAVQTGVSSTNFLNVGTAGQVITSNGVSPQYVNQSTLSVGSATTAGSVTNALTAGTYLTSGGTFDGSVARTFAVDATDANTASKVVARDANGDFAAGTITATRVTGLSAPSAGSDAANRDYVDGVAQGLDVKASCLVATTADITLASPGAVTIDGIYSATDFTAGTTRILVKDQSASAENGIYIWQGPSSAMTRSADANTWDELVGAFTFIERGTANADSGWVCTVNAGGTLGATAVTWVKFSQAGSYTAGNGIVQSGTSFNFAQSAAYTAGQIPFASSTTAMGFNANLHWDNSNNRLGIGTATPGSTLDINAGTNLNLAVGGLTLDNFTNDGVGITFSRTTDDGDLMALGVCDTNKLGLFSREGLIFATGGAALYGQTTERLRIASDGVCTWSNVGGVAGTAMTLNGTGLGVGAVPSGYQLQVENASADCLARFKSGTANVGLALDYSNSYGFSVLRKAGSDKWLYGVINESSATPGFRLQAGDGSVPFYVQYAGNVGIGTATPISKLTVNGGTGDGSSYDAITSLIRTSSTGNVLAGKIVLTDKNTNYGNIVVRIKTTPSSGESAGYYTDALTIDGQLGNLGLGVTPKAWVAGSKAIQIGTYTAVSEATGGDSNITSNAYLQAANTYKAIITGGSSRYQADFGAHKWWVNSTTNADQTIAYTQAMTLTAAGDLGIGTATINERLEVYGYGKFSSGWKIATQGIAYGDTGNSLVIGADPGNASANSSIQLMVDGSERLRIKSTGQLNFVGLASDPAGAAGDVVYNSTSNRLKYHNGTAWVNTGTNKYSGALAGTGTSFTVTHNLGTRDVTVSVRKSGSTYDQVFTDVQMTDTNTVTIIFASSVTGSDYTVTVIG